MEAMETIQLTQNQQQRLQNFRRQIEPLKAQAAALEQGVFAMLSTVVECAGADPGANYSLNEEGTALVCTNHQESAAGVMSALPMPNEGAVNGLAQ